MVSVVEQGSSVSSITLFASHSSRAYFPSGTAYKKMALAADVKDELIALEAIYGEKLSLNDGVRFYRLIAGHETVQQLPISIGMAVE